MHGGLAQSFPWQLSSCELFVTGVSCSWVDHPFVAARFILPAEATAHPSPDAVAWFLRARSSAVWWSENSNLTLVPSECCGRDLAGQHSSAACAGWMKRHSGLCFLFLKSNLEEAGKTRRHAALENKSGTPTKTAGGSTAGERAALTVL